MTDFVRCVSCHKIPVDWGNPKKIPTMTDWIPWRVESLGQLAKIVTTNNWSPGIYRGNYKNTKNFISASFVGLDFDSGDVTIEDAKQIWEGCSHIIGTTSSHTAQHHKFRVILTLAEKIEKAATMAATVSALSHRYGADVSVKDAGRLFFPCREIVSISPGDLQEVIKPTKRRPRRVIKPQPGFVSTKIMGLTTSTWVSGSRNLNCFILAKEMAKAGADSGEIFDMVRGVNIEGDFSECEMWKCIYSGIKSAIAEVGNG